MRSLAEGTEVKKTVDQKAHDLVRGERAATYGPPHYNFEVISNLWEAYLQPRVQHIVRQCGDPELDSFPIPRLLDENDVCNLMTLLKLAREASGQGYHEDSTVDAIGYQAIKEILQTPVDKFMEEVIR